MRFNIFPEITSEKCAWIWNTCDPDLGENGCSERTGTRVCTHAHAEGPWARVLEAPRALGPGGPGSPGKGPRAVCPPPCAVNARPKELAVERTWLPLLPRPPLCAHEGLDPEAGAVVVEEFNC